MTRVPSILILAILLTLTGCKSCKLSLSGVNIPPDVKNISIGYFENNASLVNPTLSQKFTESLKDRFLRGTSLAIVKSEGDFQITGEITDYKIIPVASNANTGSQKNRFSIAVRVKFVSPKHKEMDFENVIDKFQEFDASLNFQTVESTLSEEVSNQIIQEIFNKVALKW